jgi:hypothetical protein
MFEILYVHENHSILSKLRTILQKWLIISMVSVFVVTVINWVLSKFGISLENQSIIIDVIWSQSRRKVLLEIIIIGPIVEEFLFRSWINLKRYRVLVWFLSACLILLKNDLLWYSWGVLILWIVVCSIIYKTKYLTTNSWVKYSYIISSILFWLVHITNFKGFHGREILIVIPQLLLWFFLGDIRLKYGLQYSIFLHIFHNSLVGIWIVVAKYLWVRPLDTTSLHNPRMVTLIAICWWYYLITIWWIIISLLYKNDIISSNYHKEDNQFIG